MARSRDWLDRFRPAGAPGAAASPGVPSDADESERALLALFALLSPIQCQCDELVAEAEREAATRRKAADTAAAAILEAAEASVAAARAEGYAAVTQAAGAAESAVPPQSAVTLLRDAAATRMPLVVDAVSSELCSQLESLTGMRVQSSAREHSGTRS